MYTPSVEVSGGAIYVRTGCELSVASSTFKGVSAKVPCSGCPAMLVSETLPVGRCMEQALQPWIIG